MKESSREATVKLEGARTRLLDCAETGWTEHAAGPECWVRGCPKTSEYGCKIEMHHPSVPTPKGDFVLLCEHHKDKLLSGGIGWDWYKRGERNVRGPYGHETS